MQERIIRSLLVNYDNDVSKYKIAKMSGASYSWTHQFLKKLEEGKLISGTQIINYAGMINLFKASRIKSKYRYYLVKCPERILQETDMEYALTTYAAENLTQNYLFLSRYELYIKPDDLHKWQDLFLTNGLVGGGNVKIIYGDDHVFTGSMTINGLKVVSVPQLIVDLLDVGASCAEAADMLIEKQIN